LKNSKKYIEAGVDKFKVIAQFRSVKVVINVDPY
jgi:primosomal protein N' (replication factor Y)